MVEDYLDCSSICMTRVQNNGGRQIFCLVLSTRDSEYSYNCKNRRFNDASQNITHYIGSNTLAPNRSVLIHEKTWALLCCCVPILVAFALPLTSQNQQLSKPTCMKTHRRTRKSVFHTTQTSTSCFVLWTSVQKLRSSENPKTKR